MITRHLIILAGSIAVTAFGQPFYPTTISHPGAPTVSASGNSFAPLLSADRRYIIFLSSAPNLDTNENVAPHLDVFRHDLLTGHNVLLSRGAYPLHGANADSSAPSVSSNGQSVAFATRASDLAFPPASPSDTNDASDIYLSTGAYYPRTLVSADLDGSLPPNPIAPSSRPLSDNPYISADGRWVAFQSFATNLTADADPNNDSDVFLRDTVSNRTFLISVAVGANTTASSKSEIAAITPDGNYVLFTSTATNLDINAPMTGSREIYLRDVPGGNTTWIRHDDAHPYLCGWPSLSHDGRFVAYKVEFPGSNYCTVAFYDRVVDNSIVISSNSRPAYPIHVSSDGRFVAFDDSDQTYLWDRQTGTRSLVSDIVGTAAAHSPVTSDNGSIVAFVSAETNAPFQIFYRNMTTGQIRRLTENSAAVPSGKDHDGSTIVVDPQGEFILFDSAEEQLVADDRNHASDIFIHTIATGETRLLSRAQQYAPSFTAVGGATITNLCVSADGTRILFFSHDSNLVPGDTNGWQDAFLRDLNTGQTMALSTDSNGVFYPMTSVQHAILTPDGRFALLGIFDRGSRFDMPGSSGTIIRRDVDTGETLLLASNLPTVTASFSSRIDSFAFAISADGQRVAYPLYGQIIVADLLSGTETNLYVSGSGWVRPLISADGRYVVHNSGGDLFLTDLLDGQRTVITNAFDHISYRGVALSQSGQFIAYGTVSGGLGISRYSVAAGTNASVCSSCVNPAISGDGRFVAYHNIALNPRPIEVKDMRTGQIVLVTQSIFGNGGANAETAPFVLSADGRFVAYTSKATNLTTDVPNGWNNLCVYDRLQGTTIRITGSRGNAGYGSGSASQPVLGPDGRTLVFQSFASDFVQNDFNDTRDIFLLKLGGDDSDNDGMPDDWEQTHFSTTDRDGSGDFDQDGQSDLAEYLAGTNPNNAQSVLEVLQITSIGTGERQLIWAAQPGRSYRLEYKTDLEGATWTSLGQVITATSPTASAIDPTATSEKRFYRVALVQ